MKNKIGRRTIRKAMQLIAIGKEKYSCIALDRAESGYEDFFSNASDVYSDFFNKSYFVIWNFSKGEEGQNERMTALALFMEAQGDVL